MKLYSIETKNIPEWEYQGSIYSGAVLSWFMERKEEDFLPLDYHSLIEDYSKDKVLIGYAEHCLQECFTEEEKDQALSWLKYMEFPGESIITEVVLPIPNNYAPIGATGYGGGVDCSSWKGCPLPMLAHYDIRELPVIGYADQERTKERINDLKNKLGRMEDQINVLEKSLIK